MDIRIEQLDFCYGEHPVFENFSMEIAQGETLCLMGESGCGKTTLLSLLTGRLAPSSGKISGIKTQRIGMVFQENRLCEDFSAKVNVKIACSRGCYRFLPGKNHSVEDEILRHLSAVGLKDAADKKVSALSGGMKRRVAIVRAVLSDSDILLMDEPFKGLDETTKQQVLSYLLKEKGERTLIVVTHDAAEARALGGRVVQLHRRPS